MISNLHERIKNKNDCVAVSEDDEKNKDECNSDEEEKNEFENEEKLIPLLEQRLQFLLLSLTKLCLNKTNNPSQKKE